MNRFDSRKLDPLQNEQIQDHEAALNLHEILLEKGTPVLLYTARGGENREGRQGEVERSH